MPPRSDYISHFREMEKTMQLPETMQHMRFAEWNHVVKGLVEVWELARVLGMEGSLEAILAKDDGTVARQLGSVGHELLAAESLMRRSALAMTLTHSALVSDVRQSLEARVGRSADPELAGVA